MEESCVGSGEWGTALGVDLVVGALMCLARKLESHLLVIGKSLEKNCMTRFWVVLHTHRQIWVEESV